MLGRLHFWFFFLTLYFTSNVKTSVKNIIQTTSQWGFRTKNWCMHWNPKLLLEPLECIWKSNTVWNTWSFASNRFLRAKALCFVKQTSRLVELNFFLAYTFFPKKEIKTKENKKQNLSLLDAYFKYTVK